MANYLPAKSSSFAITTFRVTKAERIEAIKIAKTYQNVIKHNVRIFNNEAGIKGI